MSVLAPLYFFGALAIGAPILFHLIRRQPRGQVEFSSLMFLQPTPPRLTRRSRLDNWLLLLMRALALLLIAAAFARPFLRSAALSDLQAPARRIVMVIDTSASMQREDLWQQALNQAGEVIDDLSAGDQLAIVAFDRRPRVLLGYEQATQLTIDQLKSSARSALKDVSPSWQPTHMGLAMSFAADLAANYEPDSDSSDGEEVDRSSLRGGPSHMILISDMQQGAQIESLQSYAWPDQMALDIRRVKPKSPTNAFARILQGRDKSEDRPENESGRRQKDRLRIRVETSQSSESARFRLAWSTKSGQEVSSLPVQVPPGETRVVRMPIPNPDVTSLVLRDDDHNFDNQRYLVSPQPESLSLLYVGADDVAETGASENADQQRESLLHYLRLIPLDNVRRQVSIEVQSPKDLNVADANKTPLVVLASLVEAETADKLKSYIDGGGRVLVVLRDEKSVAMQPVLQRISGSQQLQISEAEVDDYAMLSQIDFSSPLFASMADPKFNDFTKIHIWSHRSITGTDDWSVLAKFDDGQPALLEQSIGKGTLWLLATGWQPSASQLALSTKFPPLVFNFFSPGESVQGATDDYTVGGTFEFQPSATARIGTPDGSQIRFQSEDDLHVIDRPGIYYLQEGDAVRAFAVNLELAESRTEPLGEDALERFHVTLGKTLSVAEIQANQRQLRDIELESRQRLWQWLILGALLLLAIETWLGGWLSQRESPAGGGA